jgi:SHS family lactate transporter-like MFS transporter
LERQRHFNVNTTALVSAISMVGAIVGGLLFGHLSDKWGRRRAMVRSVLLAVVAIPLWVWAPNEPLIMVGGFVMQMFVQGAWGVVPVHINELSPGPLRGFFPGLAYQIGVVLSSTVGYFEALLGEHFSYAAAMGGLAFTVLVIGAIVIWAGPEEKGKSFSHSEPVPQAVSGTV